MKFVPAILFVLMSMLASPSAQAGQAEVRDVAISNNCPPKKIEVYRQVMGAGGGTVYQVQCTLPKTVGKTDGDAKPPDALLVSCDMNLCSALRPTTLQGSK